MPQVTLATGGSIHASVATIRYDGGSGRLSGRSGRRRVPSGCLRGDAGDVVHRGSAGCASSRCYTTAPSHDAATTGAPQNEVTARRWAGHPRQQGHMETLPRPTTRPSGGLRRRGRRPVCTPAAGTPNDEHDIQGRPGRRRHCLRVPRHGHQFAGEQHGARPRRRVVRSTTACRSIEWGRRSRVTDPGWPDAERHLGQLGREPADDLRRISGGGATARASIAGKHCRRLRVRSGPRRPHRMPTSVTSWSPTSRPRTRRARVGPLAHDDHGGDAGQHRSPDDLR